MKLTAAIQGFTLGRIADGYSISTLTAYQCSLNQLARFLHDPEIETVTAANLKEFFYYLRTAHVPARRNGDTRPLTESAIHAKWKAIRSLWNWAAETLNIPPVARQLKAPVYTSKEIIPFTQEEVRLLLAACDFTATTNTERRKAYRQHRPTALRDKLILLLFLDTGIRLGELVRLQIQDLNLKTGDVTILPFGRGQKTKGRSVSLGAAARKLAWRYLEARPDAGFDALFLNDACTDPITNNAIKAMCKRLGARAGVKLVHPHRFRHTFAIQYLRNGGDIFTLKRILGHSTFEMVYRYLAIAQADTAAAHRKASPVDNWKLF